MEETYGGQLSSDPALLKSLLDAGHTIICHSLNCIPMEAFLYDGGYWYEFGGDRVPFHDESFPHVFRFLVPTPQLEPSPLEWKQLEHGGEVSGSNGWDFTVFPNGHWFVNIDGRLIFWNQAAMGGDFGEDGIEGEDMDTAKAAIHEWRVNHLKSIIGGK